MFPKIKQNKVREALTVSFGLFNRKEKVKITSFTIIQMALGFLDLIGVALLGLLGSLAVSGIQSLNASGRIVAVLKLLKIDELGFQSQISIIGILAGSILALKTLISLIITRKNLTFLSNKSAEISLILINDLMKKSLIQLREKSSQQNLFSVSQGVSTLVTGILGSFVTLCSDFTLLVILFLGLITVNVYSALATFTFFALVGIVLHLLLSTRVRRLSEMQVTNTILLNSKVLEIVQAYRETIVQNRRQHYMREINRIRMNGASLESELAFVPNISKYVMDISLVLGALLIAGLQFTFSDAKHAVGSLLVFVVSAMRIGPAILRLQQGFLVMKSGATTAQMTLEILKALPSFDKPGNDVDPENLRESSFHYFEPKISVKDLSFSFGKNQEWEIDRISFDINPGEMVAIIGPSGAGKTTLVDLILGIFPPKSGIILISGVEPLISFSLYPGSVAYVPQEIFISSGTIKENVILGYLASHVDDSRVWAALRTANLEDFVRSLPHQLETIVGENGFSLSGGQRQRLGIARALFSEPRLIIMDEATSALDLASETEISKSISELKGDRTILVIAHRLNSIKSADRVIYMNNGRIESFGSLSEVRRAIPEIDEQLRNIEGKDPL